MDVTVSNSVADGPIAEFADQNTFAADVQPPAFFLLYNSQPEAVRSFVSQPVFKALDDMYRELEGATGSRILREVSEATNPTNGILKTSALKYTQEYHDLKILDASLDLVPAKSQVLLFSPYGKEFFIEKGCFINMILLGSAIEVMTNGTLRLSRVKNTPQDTFYVAATGAQLLDNFVPLQFPNQLEYLEADRKVLDDYFQVNQGATHDRKVAVIVHEEDSYNRTGVYTAKDFAYETHFYEGVIGSLSYLANGGTMILKAVSLGSRALADLIYLYKFLFKSVSLVKTATSHILSQDHYVVAKGFKVEKFTTQQPTFLKLLNRLATDSGKARISLWSFLRNLNDADSEFARWLLATNDRIATWIVANAVTTRQALDDKAAGFPVAKPLLTLDHVTFRQSVGEVGRINNLLAVPGTITDNIRDEEQDAAAGSTVQQLTATGQVQTETVRLTPVSTALSRNFALYLALTDTVEQLVNSPAFASLLPSLGTMNDDIRVSSDVVFKEKQQLKYNLREWLGNVYALGDIDIILAAANQQEVETLLATRRWSIQEMFNVSIKAGTPLSTVTPEQVQQFLAVVFFNLNQGFKAILASNKLQQIVVRITPLQNLRFRVSYVSRLDGVTSALMSRQNPSVAGEYELLNCLTNDELAQFDDVRKIVPLVGDVNFQFRVAEHLCLSVLFAGFKNNLAVPDFYFEYEPDLEFFASAVNRHAPLWCSATPSDVELGSQGNFFGPISLADHPVYHSADGNGVKLAVAFPPSHPTIVEQTFIRCLDLYQALIDQYDETFDFAMVFVFPNQSIYNDILAVNLASRLIATELMSERIVTDAYDPFTGVTRPNINLKAFAIRTIASSFNLTL